jgi:hypothetical protein
MICNLLRRETGRLVLVVLLVIGADQMRNIEFLNKNLNFILLLSALLIQQNIIQLQISCPLKNTPPKIPFYLIGKTIKQFGDTQYKILIKCRIFQNSNQSLVVYDPVDQLALLQELDVD